MPVRPAARCCRPSCAMSCRCGTNVAQSPLRHTSPIRVPTRCKTTEQVHRAEHSPRSASPGARHRHRRRRAWHDVQACPCNERRNAQARQCGTAMRDSEGALSVASQRGILGRKVVG
ncbi:hypothetical protein HAX54_044936 [Datura stramonium]|uniref:Uncharacterized protein n=1 Tax=Datura stramonium TaxID=4076 RepID=A0ABS8WJ96_DATST|nr:hypothetical protein [Datura stramonium]